MKHRSLMASLLSLGLMTGCAGGTTQAASSTVENHPKYSCRTLDYYDYTQPVPATENPVDDSYFQDVFLGGDSRMGSLYLYSDLRNKGAQVWYCESLSLFRVYDMTNPDMYGEFGESPLYDLLTTSQKKNIYVLLGVNEIRYDNFDAWAEEYDGIIKDIKASNPTANIYIMGSYRVRAVSGLEDDVLADHLNQVNTKMQEIATANSVYFYNTNDGMLDDAGLVREDYVWDGLHFNFTGSQAFADQVARHVVQEDTYVKEICE